MLSLPTYIVVVIVAAGGGVVIAVDVIVVAVMLLMFSILFFKGEAVEAYPHATTAVTTMIIRSNSTLL